VLNRLDLSAQGRARVVLWTVLGTVGCIAVTLLCDSFSWGVLDGAERFRSISLDVIVPVILAGPLLYFFSSKLRELAIAHQALAVHASIDGLTNVLNRWAFTSLVDGELARRCERTRGVSGALLVIDVDHFKAVNDALGHDHGDEALQLLAHTIKSALRETDGLGRIGGEEFGVFLPNTSPSRARAVAERIRAAAEAAEFIVDGVRTELSLSIGGVSFMGDITFRQLYRAADARLYEAKHAGRNRVRFAALDERGDREAA